MDMSTNIIDAIVSLRRALVRAAHTTFPDDVSGRQASLMRELRSSGPLPQIALARATATDPSLIVRLLDDLERRDWVRRDRSTTDRRQRTVTLTPAGLAALQPLDACFVQLDTAAREALGPSEAETFIRLARSITGAFDTLAQTPAAAPITEKSMRP